jgi:hypothetical protein
VFKTTKGNFLLNQTILLRPPVRSPCIGYGVEGASSRDRQTTVIIDCWPYFLSLASAFDQK